MKYSIFYKNSKIGVLEINDKGMYKYTPIKEETEKLKAEICAVHELMQESDWCESIPFFKNRIDDAARFDQESDIANQTNPFRMIRED